MAALKENGGRRERKKKKIKRGRKKGKCMTQPKRPIVQGNLPS